MGFLLNTGMISVTIPKYGNATMYTSGCPKNQNRCWYSTAPPLAGSNTCAPRIRSIASPNSAAVRIGNARKINTAVNRMFHVKIGIRNIVMPGQRNVMIVVVMLTAPRMVPRPEMINPKIHRLAPVPGVYSPDNGAYAVQPNPGAPSGIKNADNNIKPPNRYSQYENAFSRGNATSGAPICNGNTILA